MVRQRSRLFILLMTVALTMGALLPAGVTGSAQLPNYRPTAASDWVTGPVDTSRPICRFVEGECVDEHQHKRA